VPGIVSWFVSSIGAVLIVYLLFSLSCARRKQKARR
jgi:hypothetical protein